MNIEVKCENCNNKVLLTRTYNGEPILCEKCFTTKINNFFVEEK